MTATKVKKEKSFEEAMERLANLPYEDAGFAKIVVGVEIFRFELDRLVELLLEGATFDISSPVNGRLAEKTARPGEHPAPGQVLGWIEEEK